MTSKVPSTTATKAVASTTSSNNIDAILATIRQMESGNNYTIVTSGGSDACGAYQYISSTWSAMFDRALAAGYLSPGTQKTARACQAPPAVQDAVARYDVTTFLQSVGGNVALVPLHWYYPAAISSWPKMSGYTPPGNSISLGDYQANWLATYKQISGDPTKYSVSAGSGQQATTQNWFSDAASAATAGLFPGGPIAQKIWDAFGGAGNSIKAINTTLGWIVNLFSNWRYVVELFAGLALVGFGVLLIMKDLGVFKAAAQAAPAIAAVAA